MKQHAIVGMCLAAMSVGLVSEAGGVNKFTITRDHGDGFIRVQKTRSDTLLSDLRTPNLTGKTTCKKGSYRVMKVGPKEIKPYNKTEASHSWTLAQNDVTWAGRATSATSHRKSQLNSACAAGHAAVTIAVEQTGYCIDGADIVTLKASPQLQFGLECMGYAISKHALYLFRNDRQVAGKRTAVFNADAGGKSMLQNREGNKRHRQSIEGQVWSSSGSGRRALYRMTMNAPDGLRETVASHPTTISWLEARGYQKGAVAGYVNINPGAGSTPLYSYFRSANQDMATAATTASINMLKDERGYALGRVEGYVLTVPNL